MEARHDLGKFITELPVAERGAVLSSGRELLAPSRLDRKIAQCVEMTTARLVRTDPKSDRRPETDRRIDNVGLLTLGAGIESSTRTGSDQTAAEALQEAETEVGTQVKVVREYGLLAGRRPINQQGDRYRPYGLKVSRFVPAHMQENRCSWWKDGDRGNCVGGNDNASDLAACRRAN